jgi:hypothetical protein
MRKRDLATSQKSNEFDFCQEQNVRAFGLKMDGPSISGSEIRSVCSQQVCQSYQDDDAVCKVFILIGVAFFAKRSLWLFLFIA